MIRTQQLDTLFAEWENAIPSYKGKFVQDGIINEIEYEKTSPKILFIAKEPNNPEQKPGDFRQWWQKEIYYTFSYRISEWAYGIINNFPPFDSIRENKENAHKALQQIALMNIKKTGGGGSCSGGVVIEHYNQNGYYLQKQIEIIAPEIIILCLSWNQVVRDGLFGKLVWVKSGYDINVAKWNNAKLIDFYHPSSRTGPAASYSLLQNIVNSSIFKGLN